MSADFSVEKRAAPRDCLTGKQAARSTIWGMLLIVLGIGTLGLYGCSFKGEAYGLSARVVPRPFVGPSKGILLIPVATTQPEFDTVAIARARDPQALDYYKKGHWADTPGRMLTPLIVQMLESTGAFAAVVIPTNYSEGDLLLELDVIRLQHELWVQPSRVRLAVRGKLFDLASGHVLGTQIFETVAVTPDEGAAGVARAADAALAQMLAQLRDFVLVYAFGSARS